MSFSLYYKSMFLKVGEDKYLPMFETAESNVWSANNPRKRSRDWGNTKFEKNNILLTEKELLSIPYKNEERLKERYSDYNGKNFGFLYGIAIGNKSTVKTSFNDYKNLFKNGLKQSISFEALKNLNITIYGYKFCSDRECNYKKFSIEKVEDILSLCENEPDVWFSFLNLSEEKYRFIKTVLNHKESKNNTWVVETNNGFIESLNDDFTINYCSNQGDAMRFSKAEAKNFFNADLIYLYKDVNSVSVRELSRCYR